MMEAVRNFTSARVHIADVTETVPGFAFGKEFRMPPTETRSLCGVALRNGVVMQPGTTVNCPPCRYLLEKGRGNGDEQ